jgi:hypothetical protein
MTKLVILGLFLFLALASCRHDPKNNATQQSREMIGKSELDPRWVYLSRDIRWERPPKEIVKELGLFSEGQGAVTIFYPSGELAIVSCDLRKDDKTGQISLDGVINFSIVTGTWSRNTDGTLLTTTRFCTAPMGVVNRTHEPSVERRCTISQPTTGRLAGLVTCNNESIVPLPDNFHDIDGVTYMLTFASHCA